MRLTRRQLIVGGAAGALGGAAGIYELVDQLAGPAPVRPAAAAPIPEQHLLDGVRLVTANRVEVLVPPLHHAVMTAEVAVGRSDLRDAQTQLERLFAGLEAVYAPSPAGLGIAAAWGKPYFERFVPAAAARLLPHDRRANVPVLLDGERFQSDPSDTVLEHNDVAFVFRSDVRAHVDDALDRVRTSPLLRPTSIRRGFAGGGFEGGRSLPKQLAVAAQVPGADLIPDTAELYLGFTSTQKAGMGPGKIANFETLGYVDFRGSDYFTNGTHMHLSHLTEDLQAWYLNFDFDERVSTAFRPDMDVPQGTQTVRQGPQDVSTGADVRRDYRESGQIGHSASIQTTSRLGRAFTAADGTVYPEGTAVPIRADFNTLDNPFAWSTNPLELGGPTAGLHFVIFNPTGDDFRRNRRAMDGQLPDGTLAFQAHARGQGFNSILSTTHRQNFLVPPRRHRSFPLAEL